MVKEDDIIEETPNLLFAILTAVGMGLIGCLLWGLLYVVNYFQWLVPAAMIFFTGWGYKKYNLKMDKKGYFIIFFISLIELALTYLLTLSLILYVGYQDTMTYAEIGPYLFKLLGGGLLVETLIELALTIFFLFVGIFAYRAFIKSKNKNMEDLLNPKEENPATPQYDPTKPTEIKVEERKENSQDKVNTEKDSENNSEKNNNIEENIENASQDSTKNDENKQ